MLSALTLYKEVNMSGYANPYSKSKRWLFVIPNGASTRQHLRDMSYIHELQFICFNLSPGRSDLGSTATVEGYLETKTKLTASSISNKLGGNAHLELVGHKYTNTRETITDYLRSIGDHYEEYQPVEPMEYHDHHE